MAYLVFVRPMSRVPMFRFCAIAASISFGCAKGEPRNYPAKPVLLVEPFGAGGGPDVIARALAPKLAELLGQPVIVENHPGAGSTAAPALVAKSPADGYTLLVNTSAHAYSAAFLKHLPVSPVEGFHSGRAAY